MPASKFNILPQKQGKSAKPKPGKPRVPANTAAGTRKRLVKAAKTILLREGAAAASVKTIAAEAGVNHGLIHHHFGSKEALMIAVHEQMPFELPILKRQDVEEDARMLMHAMFRQQRVSLELLTLSYQMPALNGRMRSRVHQVFEGYRTVLGEHSVAELTEFGATILGLAVYSDVHADLPVADALKNLLCRYIDYPDR